MTYGQRSLLAILQRTTAREVAARCAVSPSCVSDWLGGTKRPSPTSRRALELVYGIRAHTWEEPAPAVGYARGRVNRWQA